MPGFLVHNQPMSVVTVDSGICGFGAKIRAESEDGQSCRLFIESDCDAVMGMASELTEVDGFQVAFGNFMENPVYAAAAAHYRHAACPVPAAIIKAVEVACGLALPKDVAMRIEK
jgi:hypothetical protein